ncbi:hypothetical protein [Mangrovibacterium lignilyticum]|uniref:hypothetical protein n=1 Tax=Mangrovibacterium lignilyticum TaxID=2668052 RepID=UPI0013D3B74A|nr:hypothetical protein [Mangrovibacterium lignilyticum]
MKNDNKIQICDCTLRDGGYYTNWDFDVDLVKSYLSSMNENPAITHIEIGYRSNPVPEYHGEYFYCPDHVLKLASQLCKNKKIAIMLNERDTQVKDLDRLLAPCLSYIHVVRLAVDPKNLNRAITLCRVIKEKGFEIGFNIMYMPNWINDNIFIRQLKKLDGLADFIYLVDSFGSIYPEDIQYAIENIKKETNIPIGFHGHNNLELGLANSLKALENGCQIIDATITGIGRGAGNLRTELLLTSLNAKKLVKVDYNKLNPIVARFEKMKLKYAWGTNLPYMISGAYSLPQKEVMNWISKRRYTTESIINALQNKKNKIIDNFDVPLLRNESPIKQVVIVGGGSNSMKHSHALKLFCLKNPQTAIIHAGTRFVHLFNELPNLQYYCLLGSEGYKLEKSLPKLDLSNVKCIIEPSPRKMGTILPDKIIATTYELSEINFIDDYPNSLLTLAFQLTVNLKAQEIFLFGLDGYDLKTDEQMIEVSKENQILVDRLLFLNMRLKTFTPSKYQGLETESIYSKL